MSDFYLEHSIQRDQLAALMVDTPEHAPYTLTLVLKSILELRGTMEYDNIRDEFECMNDEQRKVWTDFAKFIDGTEV